MKINSNVRKCALSRELVKLIQGGLFSVFHFKCIFYTKKKRPWPNINLNEANCIKSPKSIPERRK